MFVRTVDHIAVTVSNLDRSLAFYQDVLGLREVERHRLAGPGIEQMADKPGTILQVVRLAAPDSPKVLVDLQEYLAPKGKQSDSKLGDIANAHFCFGVKGLARTYRQLKEQGVDFVSEPVTFDLESGKCDVVFLRDPDGFILELMDVSE